MTKAQPITTLAQAVDQTRADHVIAVNAGDAGAAADLFSSDGFLLPPAQPPLDGPEAIRGWFKHLFAAFDVDGFSIHPGNLAEYGDLAIEHGSWSGTFRPRGAREGLFAQGTYLTIYQRMPDGSARILRDTFNGLNG